MGSIAPGELANYLSEATADYSYVLDIPPQNVMDVTGDKKQIIHEFDDGSIAVASKSNQSYFDLAVEWDVLEPDDADAIFDLWHDEDKANGRENTFYWEHPIELNVYTVRFITNIKRTQSHQNYLLASISGAVLRVVGYAPSGIF